MPTARVRTLAASLFFASAAIAITACVHNAAVLARPEVDPAAWGADFAGQPIPQMPEGGQCLFCHREPVASRWAVDRHNTTVRSIHDAKAALDALNALPQTEAAREAAWVLGHTRQQRYLKPGPAYGSAHMLDARLDPKTDSLHAGHGRWDSQTFAQSCAGCHASGFDTTSSAFLTPSLDCFVCHGNVPIEHTTDPTRVLLAKSNMPTPEATVSLCGSCHIRTGKSRSSGRPFPNNFLPGDNLFRDLDVDLSDAAIAGLNPVDRHVLENVRDVAIRGQKEVTCLSCHAIHLRNTLRHRKLKDQPACFTCHTGIDTKSGVREWTVHSELCGY